MPETINPVKKAAAAKLAAQKGKQRNSIVAAVQKNKSKTTALANVASSSAVAAVGEIEVVAARQSTTLYKRAILGDVEGLTEMIKNGMDVNMKDSAGNSPLSLAAYHGQEKAFECLVAFEADTATKDAKSWTVMHCAVAGGEARMVRFLCKMMGLSPNVTDSSGYTPAHIAAHEDKSEILQSLFDCNADFFQAGYDGCTPAHMAAQANSMAAVKVIYECVGVKGLLVEDKREEIAAHKAARFNHTALIRYLKQIGAFQDVLNKDGDTPEEIEQGSGRFDLEGDHFVYEYEHNYNDSMF